MQKFRGSKTRLMTLQIKTPLPPQISFSHQRNSLRIKQFQLFFFFSRSCWCCYCLNEVDLLSFSSRADTQRQAISRQLANFAHKHSRAKPRKLYKYTRNVQTSKTQKWLWMSTSLSKVNCVGNLNTLWKCLRRRLSGGQHFRSKTFCSSSWQMAAKCMGVETSTTT